MGQVIFNGTASSDQINRLEEWTWHSNKRFMRTQNHPSSIIVRFILYLHCSQSSRYLCSVSPRNEYFNILLKNRLQFFTNLRLSQIKIVVVFVVDTNPYFSFKHYTLTDSEVYNSDVASYAFKEPGFWLPIINTMSVFHFMSRFIMWITWRNVYNLLRKIIETSGLPFA
jgi:hypothetical protein